MLSHSIFLSLPLYSLLDSVILYVMSKMLGVETSWGLKLAESWVSNKARIVPAMMNNDFSDLKDN